jgi:AhpD family alkylhydroperoxidase
MTIPKVNVREVAPGEDAALYLNSLTDQRAVRAYMEFFVATVGVPPADPELVELLRVRNGLAQSCEYCLSVRHADALQHGREVEDKVLRFEQSDLPERYKAALRLAAAFLEAPSGLTPEARAEALKHFSAEEIVGIVLKLTSFLVNKPRSALGIDGALDAERLTPFDWGLAEKFMPAESYSES